MVWECDTEADGVLPMEETAVWIDYDGDPLRGGVLPTDDYTADVKVHTWWGAGP